MKLLLNEEKLTASNGNNVILTNQRVHMNTKEWGKASRIDIFLENISSIETKYTSNIFLLALAGLTILGGLFLGLVDNNENGMMVGCLVGLFFIVFWWLSRTNVISISSKGGAKLNFVVTGMSAENVTDFVNKVNEAQLKRVNLLNKL